MSFLSRVSQALLALVASSSWALASSLLEGEVVAVQGSTVQVELAGDAPDWLRKGAVVQAIGWDASVAEIDGNIVSLRFEGNRASDARVGGNIAIREIPAEQFSCG